MPIFSVPLLSFSTSGGAVGFSDATDGAVDADDPAGEFDVHADNAKLDISAVASNKMSSSFFIYVSSIYFYWGLPPIRVVVIRQIRI